MKLWPRKKYVTARAIIIEDGKVLLFYRKRRDRDGNWIEYYSIPGGEIDKGETPEKAVIRELREEMGVGIENLGLVARSRDHWFEHNVFSARIVEGKPHFVADSEEALRYSNDSNIYEVVWVPVGQLTEDNLKFYKPFLPHIQALASGQSVDEVKRIHI